MIDPEAHGIISNVLDRFLADDDLDTVTNAIVGALAFGGFAIVAVEADVVRRVLSEMAKKDGR
jgi:hypothetical protein